MGCLQRQLILFTQISIKEKILQTNINNRNKKVEILAPAGSFESFLAAISAGADAVYAGGPCFRARAFATNFTEEKLNQNQ